MLHVSIACIVWCDTQARSGGRSVRSKSPLICVIRAADKRSCHRGSVAQLIPGTCASCHTSHYRTTRNEPHVTQGNLMPCCYSIPTSMSRITNNTISTHPTHVCRLARCYALPRLSCTTRELMSEPAKGPNLQSEQGVAQASSNECARG